MNNTEDKEAKQPADTAGDHHLVLDGTVNLDYSDDEVPQVKGLIELLQDYLAPRHI
jgi:hypothetical protein